MTDTNTIFNSLSRHSYKDLLKLPLDRLVQIIHYLETDLTNIETKFSKIEFKVSKDIKYLISNTPSGLKKALPFLMTSEEKRKISFFKEIDLLFTKKALNIKNIYAKDISIVEEFLLYTHDKMKAKELFYYDQLYEGLAWTKKEFGNNLYKYFACQLRLNPSFLTATYIEDFKMRFPLSNLNCDDLNKTYELNQYFLKSPNPFSLNIPEKYARLATEILIAIKCMTESDKLFDRIIADVTKKYSL